MRKGCKQTCKPKGLMQNLSKGGWIKKAKKATAAILAAAMVLTSSVALPQNTKTAEAAAPIATIGTDNGDGTYTLEWFNYTNFHGTELPAGDFSVSYNFHNKSAGANNWMHFAVALTTDLTRGNQLAGDWYMRADCYNNSTFDGSTVTFDYGNINWDTFKDILKDSDVSVSVSRTGTTVTIACAATNSNSDEVHWGATATGCPTDAVKVYLGGENCLLTVNSATVAPRHELTVNCVDSEGTVLKTETKTLVEGLPYSFAAPAITGYIPKTATVSGTMGAADETITVEYDSTPTKNVIIHCVSATTGAEISQKIEKAPINMPFEYEVPTISGYLPVSTEPITGEMAEEDMEFTVQYKAYDSVLNIGGNYSDLTTGYKVKKSGDFDIAFSFHNVSTDLGGPWFNYAVAISTDVTGDWAHAWATGGWFLRADRFSIHTFSGVNDDFFAEGTGKSYTLTSGGSWDDVDWDLVKETLKESDVTVGISRRGSTITISNSVVGANGETFSWIATDEKAPTDTVAVTLTGENCRLYLYDVPEADLPMVPPTDNDTEGVIETIGSGSYDLKWNDYDKFRQSAAPANDFTVTYKFHNNSAGDTNWNNYAVILKTADGKTWHQRADWWALGQDSDSAIFGKGVPSYSEITFDPPTFLATIQDSDVTVTVVRSGSTITIYNIISGKNGKTLSWSASSSECPTDEITVMLGGEACKLKLMAEDIKNEASDAPTVPDTPSTDTPSTDTPGTDTPATDTPSTDTPGTDTPATDTPGTNTPAPEEPTPTAKPVVKNGDKVTNSGVTYKVTSTKNKAVSYTAIKNSKKTSVTVPNTVAVTSSGKKVTYKVTTIAKNTFKGNKTVKKITIGTNITKIEANAFKDCKNLTTIVIKSTKLTSVGKNVLSGTNKKLVIKVPAKKVAAYQKLFKAKGNTNIVVKKA